MFWLDWVISFRDLSCSWDITGQQMVFHSLDLSTSAETSTCFALKWLVVFKVRFLATFCYFLLTFQFTFCLLFEKVKWKGPHEVLFKAVYFSAAFCLTFGFTFYLSRLMCFKLQLINFGVDSRVPWLIDWCCPLHWSMPPLPLTPFLANIIMYLCHPVLIWV